MNMLLWTTRVTEQHFGLFEDLERTGFDGVEIPVHHADVDYRALGAELQRQGLECTAVTSLDGATNPVSPDRGVRRAALARLEWAMDMALELGSDRLVGPFHSAYAEFPGHGPTEDERAWCADVLRQAAEAAERRGLVLRVEYLNRFECYMLTTAAQARDLVRRVDHPALGMLYDTHHAHIEEQDVAAAILASREEIGHVHVSENDRGTPGKGQVAWTETFRGLREIGYDGWLVIEAFSRADPRFATAIRIWRDLAPSLEDVYREGCAFIKRSWAEVKL